MAAGAIAAAIVFVAEKNPRRRRTPESTWLLVAKILRFTSRPFRPPGGLAAACCRRGHSDSIATEQRASMGRGWLVRAGFLQR